MDTDSALRAMVAHSGMSARAVAVASGRSPGYLTGLLAKGTNPSIAVTAELAAPCGYAVALVPLASPLPLGSLVIDPPRPTA